MSVKHLLPLILPEPKCSAVQAFENEETESLRRKNELIIMKATNLRENDSKSSYDNYVFYTKKSVSEIDDKLCTRSKFTNKFQKKTLDPFKYNP